MSSMGTSARWASNQQRAEPDVLQTPEVQRKPEDWFHNQQGHFSRADNQTTCSQNILCAGWPAVSVTGPTLNTGRRSSAVRLPLVVLVTTSGPYSRSQLTQTKELHHDGKLKPGDVEAPDPPSPEVLMVTWRVAQWLLTTAGSSLPPGRLSSITPRDQSRWKPDKKPCWRVRSLFWGEIPAAIISEPTICTVSDIFRLLMESVRGWIDKMESSPECL